jgi:hypothetical protein
MSEFQAVNESELQSVEGGALWLLAPAAGAQGAAIAVLAGVAIATTAGVIYLALK